MTSSPPPTTTKLRHLRKMANEEQDEATSLYISFMMSMVMAQMRCTTAHSPSRCLFLSDVSDNNSNIISFDFLVTIPEKNLEHAQNTRSDPLSSPFTFNGQLNRVISGGLNSIASNPIRSDPFLCQIKVST